MTATAQHWERLGHLDFALALHRAIAADPHVQSCFSPFSVASALALAARGAAGATRDELVTLLGGSLDALTDELTRASTCAEEPVGEQPELAVANTVWTRDDLEPRPDFVAALRNRANGSVRGAPFAQAPERAREMINADVAETTRDLIPELIPSGAITAETVATIVNALYLKAAWRTRFPEQATKSAPFAGSGRVPTMRRVGAMPYVAAHGWQAVTLAATGGVEAVALLPDDDLARAEPTLDAAVLGELLAGGTPAEVDLSLPKFEVSVSTPLTEPLGGLGVHTMFSRSADFTAMTRTPLTVSAVLHEAVLRVDEDGFEGAAATAVMMKMSMAVRKPDPIVVRFDRPFLFVVRHVDTGAVYFLTRVVRP